MKRVIHLMGLMGIIAVAGCDRGNDEVSSRKAAPSLRMSAERGKMTPEERASARRRELVAAAMRDPEIRALQAEVEKKLADREEVDRVLSESEDLFALMKCYAQRYPEDGMAWIASLPAETDRRTAWYLFGGEVYKVRPDRGFELLEGLPKDGPAYGLCLAGVCWNARGADIARAWTLADDPVAGLPGSFEFVKISMLSREARTDPMTAWERALEHMGPDFPAERFIGSMSVLAEGVSFPASLFDKVPVGDPLRKAMFRALMVSPGKANREPIERWMEAAPEGRDYDQSYWALIHYHMAEDQDPAAARKWVGRLTDPDERKQAEEMLNERKAVK